MIDRRDRQRIAKTWLLNGFVIRCMRCGWLFRSHERYRTKCRACESRYHPGGTNGDHHTDTA